MLRVISIGNDRQIFTPESAVAKRVISYGQLFGEYHVIVFALKNKGFSVFKLSHNVYVYPTNSTNRFWYITDAVKIGKEIAKGIFFGESVISTQDPYDTGPAGLILKWLTGLHLQIQVHADIFSKKFYDGSFLNGLRLYISRLTLSRADGIRVVREKIAEDLANKLKIKRGKIAILPIFVDINKIRNAPITLNLKEKYPHWEKIILVASRLTEEKGVDKAIRAFARIAKRFPNTLMVVVGDGAEKKKLRALAQKLIPAGQIIFESWQEDLYSYYKTASVFLNTSKFEGFGMALVEAAAAGCPIVTTEVGVAQDLFHDGRSALICPVGDEVFLANKLTDLLENSIAAGSLTMEAWKVADGISHNEEEYLK